MRGKSVLNRILRSSLASNATGGIGGIRNVAQISQMEFAQSIFTGQSLLIRAEGINNLSVAAQNKLANTTIVLPDLYGALADDDGT